MPAAGHNYAETVYEPTCVSQGYTKHVCTVCSEEYSDNIREKLPHDYEIVTTEVTCLTDGFTLYSCKNCDESYVADVVKATGHKYAENKVKATCVAYGYTEHKCEACGDRYVTNYEKPTGHDYSDTVIEPTENSLGYTKHVCDKCGYVYLDNYVTSGEGGYKDAEDPKEPEQPEQPDEPNPPHTHVYSLDYETNAETKTIFIVYACECGEDKTADLRVEISEENGELSVLIPVDGKIDLNGFYGKQTISVIDDGGETISEFIFELPAKEETPKPTEPGDKDENDKPQEGGAEMGNNPDKDKTEEPPPKENEPNEKNDGGKPSDGGKNNEPQEEIETNKKMNWKAGLISFAAVAGIGAAVAFAVLKKRNTKNKKTKGENKK